MKLFTIGFTKKSAEIFFTLLRDARVKRLIDVRLNNVSQLAGFTKKEDLRYFSKQICDIEYLHMPQLAPTAEILEPYKKSKNGNWRLYEQQFLDLMQARHIEQIEPATLEGACLLCSEEKPHNCHRRLVAEYLKDHWTDVQIEHIP